MYTKENGFSQVIKKLYRSYLKMNRTKVLHMIFIFLLFITPKYFSQNASFQGLGDLPGGVFESSAQSVNADGSVVVGYSMSDSSAQAFIWTESSGMVSLGNLPDSSFKQSWANNISANGKVIVGYGDPVGSGWDTYKGFIWTVESGMREMGSLNNSARSMAFNVSGDGSVVVGDGGPEAFRWTQETGIEGLGVLPSKTNSRAIDISKDGFVIIGQSYSLPAWNDEDGFIWTQSGGMKAMSSLTGGKYCMLLAISHDGSVIAGTTRTSSTNYPAFLWNESKGMVTIGHLPGRNTTHPSDMTPYGKIIVGGSFSGPTSGDAFIWDSTNGMRKLQTVLKTEYGLNLTGWTIQNASGITPDGNIIVGHGINPSGKQEAFRVVLDTLINARDTVTDIDGNVYQTVTIGTQVWMKENLKTTRYRNGDLIGTTNPATLDIKNESAPKYQWIFENNQSDLAVYGRLYTWYAVTDNRNIAPNGWHVPTDDEWTTLINFLGGDSLAGGKLKESDITHWKSPNTGATNESGFTALPGGCRPENGVFDGGGVFIGDKHHYGGWWSSSEKNFSTAWNRYMSYKDAVITFFDNTYGYDGKKWGFSVRCLKDAPTGVNEFKNGNQIPNEIKLNQNYPNPFNPSTVISYQLSESSNVKIKIYDMLGREIKTLVDSFQNTGEHSVVWNGIDGIDNLVSSGIYFYQLETDKTNLQKKMILVR
jgi:uncharacterized protein (TIGR02145 family)